MNATGKPTIRYEDNAERRTDLVGWCCKACGRYWGADEHMARWCCATDLPCDIEGCDGRARKHGFTTCDACRRRKDDERWAAVEKVAWDGVTPLCEWDGDRFFFDDGAVADYVADRLADGVAIEEIHLVLCERDTPRSFDMADFQSDYLAREWDCGRHFDEIDKVVNDWIAAHMPPMWIPSGPAIDPASLPVPVSDDDDDGSEAPQS
jgi:hypothetical protein